MLSASCTGKRFEAFEPGQVGSGHSPSELTAIPIILTGRVLSNKSVGRAYAPEWDPYVQIQLYRVTVRVENVFRGEVKKGEIPIYYFGYTGRPAGGPPYVGVRSNGGRWVIGDLVLFFLSGEANELRTVCDFRDMCATQVLTGSHPNFKIDRTKPFGCSIADLLLSRGPKTTNAQMARAILGKLPYVFSETCTKGRLEELARDPSPIVREAALCVTRAPVDRPCQMKIPADDSAAQ